MNVAPINAESKLKVSENTQSLMRALLRLYNWELDNIPCTRTMTGRHLYFSAIGHVDDASPPAQSMKQLFTHPWLTERALRTRMQQLQADGLFDIYTGADARSRWVVETTKLRHTIQEHNYQAAKFIAQDFYLIHR